MRKKSIAAIIIFVVIFLAIFIAGTAIVSNGNVFDIFFHGNNSNKAQELLDYNGQSVKVDDYTIALEQTLFDSKTSIGYVVFAITKDNGKPETLMNGSNSFGKNERFYTEIEATGGQTRKYKYIGDTLYEYISFSTSGYYDLTVNLIDTRANEGDKVYTFKIKNNHKYIEYQINKLINLTISPLGIAIDTSNSLGDISITFHYKNGKEEKVVDTLNKIGTGGSGVASTDYGRRYQFIFKQIKDIEQIEYIIYNGEKYEG